MGRTLQFDIFRFNPREEHAVPRMESFRIEEYSSMTIFLALTHIREKMDPTLQFDFCCRAGVCGSCGMVINGRPKLACHTQTSTLPDTITLHPLPVFKLLGDLSVDTGSWFRNVAAKIESWIHSSKEFDESAQEDRMPNSVANEIFELDRCIECGCCVAACGTARMREDFIGATSINRLARFHIDPRDERTPRDFYDLVGDDNGIFGCMGLLACEDVCPRDIPLQDRLGIMRRMVSLESVRSLVPAAGMRFLESRRGCGQHK